MISLATSSSGIPIVNVDSSTLFYPIRSQHTLLLASMHFILHFLFCARVTSTNACFYARYSPFLLPNTRIALLNLANSALQFFCQFLLSFLQIILLIAIHPFFSHKTTYRINSVGSKQKRVVHVLCDLFSQLIFTCSNQFLVLLLFRQQFIQLLDVLVIP